MHTSAYIAVLIGGIIVGFGFRGFIGRQKLAIGEHVMAAVKSGEAWAVKLLSEVKAKL